MFLKFFRCYTRFFTTYRNDRVSMEWFLLRLTVNRLMHFCCDQKKIFSYFFLRLKVKICTFFRLTTKFFCRFTANGLPHCYSQTRVGEQGGRARALREVWFLFSSHNTRGFLLTPPASSKQVDLAASVADQLRACSQAQLKPSAEPDEDCSSLFQVLRQKRRAKEWERERFGFHSWQPQLPRPSASHFSCAHSIACFLWLKAWHNLWFFRCYNFSLCHLITAGIVKLLSPGRYLWQKTKQKGKEISQPHNCCQQPWNSAVCQNEAFP